MQTLGKLMTQKIQVLEKATIDNMKALKMNTEKIIPF